MSGLNGGPGPSIPVVPAKRSRGANQSACEPCRSRKRKCTGERPTCSACAASNKRCSYTSSSSADGAVDASSHRSGSVPVHPSAFARVSGTPGSSTMPGQESAQIISSSPTQARHSLPINNSRSSIQPQESPSSEYQARNVPAAELDNPSPRYEAILTTYPKPHDRPLPSNDQALFHLPTDLEVGSLLEQNSALKAPLSNTASLVIIDKSILPSPPDIEDLYHHFQFHTSAAYPIFHLPTFRQWLEDVCFDAKATEAEIVCAVLLVLAVSATSLPHRSPKEYLKLRAASLWEYGQKFLPPVFLPPIDDRRGLIRVQVMLIRLQYVLHNPNSGNVWGLSGAAVRASVDLGLHHEGRLPSSGRSAVEEDVRRRVFWISYSCDRELGMALGRPPAIQDEWVTAKFPSDRDDTCITAEGISIGAPSPYKLTALHLFRIRRLQSKIIHALYASGQTQHPGPEWFNQIQDAIEAWGRERPEGRGFCSDEWLSLCYHQTTTLLHRPSPGNPSPTRESLTKALQGSNAAMRLYKESYRKGRMDFGWLSMYHLFISGVTYLNSLWQAYRNGWRLVPSYVDALLDMQVCTSVMEGLAALTPGAISIRNTWEIVSEKMIRQLSANARWDPLSRPGSPAPQPANQGELFDINSIAFPAQTNNDISNSVFSNNGNEISAFAENPFDPFFLQPLGEMSNEDWTRAIAAVFEPAPNQVDLPFQ